jgi:hypothetical protein
MSPEYPTSTPRLTLISGGDPDQGTPQTERIQVAPDVAHALGAATVMRLRSDPTLTDFVCQFCCRKDTLDGSGATVIAVRWVNGLTVIRFAHPECSPSAVLNVLRRPQPPAVRVRAACCLPPEPVTAAWTSRAVLLISHDVRSWPRAHASDAAERYISALHTVGFIRLTRLDQTPPILPRLTVTLESDHDTDHEIAYPSADVEQIRVIVEHPNGLLFDGDLDVPGPWRQAAQASRHVVLLTGPGNHLTGLPDGLLPDPTTGQIWAAVAALSIDATTARDTPQARRA